MRQSMLSNDRGQLVAFSIYICVQHDAREVAVRVMWLVASHSGRTSLSDWRTFPVSLCQQAVRLTALLQ